MSISKGNYRPLTPSEKLRNPAFKYVISRPYQLTINDKKITVPRGFLTDGSSGGPDVGSSWVFHDYLYATHRYDSGHPCTQKEADDIMLSVLVLEGLHLYAFVYKIVNYLFKSRFAQAFESSGKRGSVFII